MKLIEALQIANAPHEGPPFHVLLACGFTPLHLETAVKAHLSVGLPTRSIKIRTGLYGDLAGTLEGGRELPDVALVAIEWGDLDPRLAWRSAGRVNEEVIADARARLNRIEKAISVLAEKTPVAFEPTDAAAGARAARVGKRIESHRVSALGNAICARGLDARRSTPSPDLGPRKWP